jgi:uncharacterized membrane protein YdcZ (DUF606 family)
MSAADKFTAIIMGPMLAGYLYIAFFAYVVKYKPVSGPQVVGLFLTVIGTAIALMYFL